VLRMQGVFASALRALFRFPSLVQKGPRGLW
jgi:hypothetical protein